MLKKLTLEKKGFFFILDAVLGLIIIIIGVFLISNSRVNVQPPTQVSLLSNDLLNFFSKTKIKDLNNPYAGIGGELWNGGVITDQENSLLQQIGEFYATNKGGIAESFVESVSKDIVPYQYRYEVWMNGDIIYPANPSPVHVQSKQSTKLLLTSKKITFGIVNGTLSKIWGPYTAEVFVWEK